jgi:hypothetical protein
MGRSLVLWRNFSRRETTGGSHKEPATVIKAFDKIRKEKGRGKNHKLCFAF